MYCIVHVAHGATTNKADMKEKNLEQQFHNFCAKISFFFTIKPWYQWAFQSLTLLHPKSGYQLIHLTLSQLNQILRYLEGSPIYEALDS